MKVIYINETTGNLEHNKIYDVLSETTYIDGGVYYLVEGKFGILLSIENNFKDLSYIREMKINQLLDT